MALRQALASTTLPARFRAAESVMQCSSLGALDQRWLDEFADSLAAGSYADDEDDALAAGGAGGAAGGCNGSQSSGAGGAGSSRGTPSGDGGAAKKGGSSNNGSQQQRGQLPRRPRLHLVWPTADEVRHSIEGWDAGRSIPSWSQKVHVACLQQLFRR
jgi:hypothetical protein